MREHSRDRGRLEDIVKYAQNVNFIISVDPYSEVDNAAYKQAVDTARKMKVKGYAVQDIAEVTGLTAEKIEAL